MDTINQKQVKFAALKDILNKAGITRTNRCKSIPAILVAIWLAMGLAGTAVACPIDAETAAKLQTPLAQLDVSVRAYNVLKAANISTLGELVSYQIADLLKFRNFGKKSLTELEELVADKGLRFGMKTTCPDTTSGGSSGSTSTTPITPTAPPITASCPNNALLQTTIAQLDLSVRAYNVLKAAKINTLGELVSYQITDLLKLRNFGKKSLTELEELVADKGLRFGMQTSTSCPIGHWLFNEGSGTTAADTGVGRLNATLVGGAAFSSLTANTGSNNPNALTFNGIDAHATIVDHNTINFGTNDEFTIAVWIKAEATQSHTNNVDNDVVEKWSESGGYPFVIRYLNQRDSAKNGKIVVARYDGSNNPAIVSTRAINDGQFHHVVFVKQSNTLRLFIDGVADGTTTDTTTGNTGNTSPLYLGRRGGGQPNWFQGAIDDLRIYNIALPDSQIKLLARSAPGTL